MYYLRNKHAGYLGNSPMWWRLKGAGYTPFTDEAERFTYEEVVDRIKEDPTKWEAYAADFIDKYSRPVFDSQLFPRLSEWANVNNLAVAELKLGKDL